MVRTMKVLFFVLLFLTGIASCSKHDKGDSGKMLLSIRMNSSASGGIMQEKGSQHVVYVHLYVFSKKEDGRYTCDWSTPLEWYSEQDSDYGDQPDMNNGVPSRTKTFKIDFSSVYDMSKRAEYRFLVVGLDEKPDDAFLSLSSATYGLPGAVKAGNETEEGSDFETLVAKVQQGCSYTRNVSRSEFFTGYTDYSGSLNSASVSVTAIRRVAGFKAYLKLPFDVARVELVAADRLNNAVPLVKSDEDYLYGGEYLYEPTEEDMNSGVSDRVMAFKELGIGTGAVQEIVEFVTYMLPIRFNFVEGTGMGTSTLGLKLYDFSGTLIGTYRIYHKQAIAVKGGTGIIDGNGDIVYNEYYHYPINANHLYVLGSEDDPVILDGSMTDIEVTIDDVWDQYYGGHMDGSTDGNNNIDTDWGDYPAGELDPVK